MEQVSVTVDGMQMNGARGSTIFETAENAGIMIPRLCHRDGLKPSGNCRVCVVEVEGARTLVASCHTPIAEGMEISTRSARVLQARRAIIELLLTAHTGSCVTDSEARECGLHKIASDFEVGPPRFRVRRPRLYAPENASPYVLRDMSKCILCRNCVRACREVAGQTVYSMAYRAFGSKVVVDCDVPLDKEVCKDCGVCIEYCPTSALLWPEGVKKREGAFQKKVTGKPENGAREKLLDLLKEQQRRTGCLSEQSMAEIAGDLGIPMGDVYGVASFYAFLSTRPQGRNIIRICKSLPCHIKDAPMIIASVRQTIGIMPGETTRDGRFSFELTNCIGACDQAPAMLLNDTVYGNLTPGKIVEILQSHRDR